MMPETIITPANITFVIGMLAAIFAVFFYFRKPQEELETKQALTEKDIGSKATILAQLEMANKAALLDQQVKLERESNEKKFSEFGIRLDKAFELAANHTHTVDVKVDKLIETVTSMSNKIVKLSTIIDERIPRKNS